VLLVELGERDPERVHLACVPLTALRLLRLLQCSAAPACGRMTRRACAVGERRMGGRL
jgi:hypothetical protein